MGGCFWMSSPNENDVIEMEYTTTPKIIHLDKVWLSTIMGLFCKFGWIYGSLDATKMIFNENSSLC